MKLTGLHFLLTYQCNFECDHCFVWGSPRQSGTFTLQRLEQVLVQCAEVPGCEWIYFEGGEPFLYFVIMQLGARKAREMGFKVGIVSNGYWATGRQDALEWLRPFQDVVEDLSLSSDLYHRDERLDPRTDHARWAAEALGIPVGVISISPPEQAGGEAVGQLPPGESRVMYRGRAAETLKAGRAGKPWNRFTECPHEDLEEPGRLHVDPFGHLHICQGISIGNLFARPLKEICETYDAGRHPIVGPIVRGGPAALLREHDIRTRKKYSDACHLCYAGRKRLRSKFPDHLLPGQMYGEF